MPDPDPKPQPQPQEAPQTSSSAQSSQEQPPEKPKESPFMYPDGRPMHAAIDGVTFDFNLGARVLADSSMDPEKTPALLMVDLDSGNILHHGVLKPGYCVSCSKKFYIRYRLELRDRKGAVLWTHDIDMKDRQVLVQMPVKGALGDSIAWFSMLERFQAKHGCELHVLMPSHIADLFRDQYPDMRFETPETVKTLRPYASYYLGLFFKGDVDWQPYDFRTVSLSETSGLILGLDDLSDIPPRVKIGPGTIQEPYVCMAVQASAHAKHWCNPSGWRVLTAMLKDRGYRVLCIDKDHEVGSGEVWHRTPSGVEDFVGNRPLQERVDLIGNSSFFVGLSSGLGWIAWCTGVPVVRISGICAPWGEFRTPYFVQCRHTCHGCWNDTRYEFDHKDFLWCPVHKEDGRAYECTKAITPQMADGVISRIPGVLPHGAGAQQDGHRR